MMKSTKEQKQKTNARGAKLLVLFLCILLAGLPLCSCTTGDQDGSSSAFSSGADVPGSDEPEEIEGTALGAWQESALISERDNKPHPVKVRITKIDSKPENVKKQIDAYNVSAAGHMIPALDDPHYTYVIAHYEVAFPEDYPDGDYGITQVAPAFTISAADGSDVIRTGDANYTGLTETFEIGYQPRGYDFHAGETYEGAIVYVMVNGYENYRIVENVPAEDGKTEPHYYMPR